MYQIVEQFQKNIINNSYERVFFCLVGAVMKLNNEEMVTIEDLRKRNNV